MFIVTRFHTAPKQLCHILTQPIEILTHPRAIGVVLNHYKWWVTWVAGCICLFVEFVCLLVVVFVCLFVVFFVVV